MAKYNGLRAGIMNENLGSLASGSGGLSAQDIQGINTAVPGAGAQKFMNWQPDSRVGAAQPMNPMMGGGLSMDTPVDLSKPVAPAAIDAAFVKGRLAATGEQLDIAKNTREEKKFGWEESEYKREVAIREGMAQASQLGGYTGVVEFLKQVDPDKALKFEMKKNDLDQALMSTDVYKMAHSNDKLKVMVEGYDILSKMGAGLLFAKPEERGAMYEGMKPLFAQVLGEGNVPDTVEAAAPMLMMAAAQNDPKNLQTQAAKLREGAASTIGKLQQDYNNYIAQGGSIEDPEAKNIQKQIDALNTKADQATDVAQTAHYRNIMNNAKTQNDNYKIQSAMQDDYNKDPVIKSAATQTQVLDKLNSLLSQTAPGQGQTGTALAYTLAKWWGDSRVSDADFDIQTKGSSTLMNLKKTIESAYDSKGQVSFDSTQLGQIKDLISATQSIQTKRVNERNDYWREQSLRFSRPPSQDGVDKGFQVNLQYLNQPPQEDIEILKKAPTPKNQEYFKNHYGQGALDSVMNSLGTPE